jgi:hypothetical protein
MLDKIFSFLIYYITFGFHIAAQHIMTMEGMIGLFFGIFFLGFLSRIRSSY